MYSETPSESFIFNDSTFPLEFGVLLVSIVQPLCKLFEEFSTPLDIEYRVLSCSLLFFSISAFNCVIKCLILVTYARYTTLNAGHTSVTSLCSLTVSDTCNECQKYFYYHPSWIHPEFSDRPELSYLGSSCATSLSRVCCCFFGLGVVKIGFPRSWLFGIGTWSFQLTTVQVLI
jgi:hypothetical protein